MAAKNKTTLPAPGENFYIDLLRSQFARDGLTEEEIEREVVKSEKARARAIARCERAL